MTESKKKNWVDKPKSLRNRAVGRVQPKRHRVTRLTDGLNRVPPTASSDTVKQLPPAIVESAGKSVEPRWVIGLIAAFVAIVFYLFYFNNMMELAQNADLGETTWARAQWLFQGIEAIAFAAAGLLFGVVVERRSTQRAENQASEAESKRNKAESALLETRETASQALMLLERRRQFSEASAPDPVISLLRKIAAGRLN